MKKLKYILGSVALAGTFAACNDLNTQPLGGIVTEEQRSEIINSNPDAIDALASGIYGNYNGWELTYAGQQDFGYPAIMVQLDCRTADYFSINVNLYGWFSAPAEYLDNTATSSYNISRWRLPYNTIYSSNAVLGAIEADTEDNTLLYYRAQAYANRAFAYWNLAQLYQFNYVNHQNDPCVPLITEENAEEVSLNGAPRASVKEIYEQIISDLDTSIELMDGNPAAVRADKRYIDINVAYGLRARAYLCMQEYDKAAEDAYAVISSGRFAPLSAQQALLPGYNDFTAQNWVWGIYESTETTNGLYTLAGFVGSYTYGYAYVGMWKAINSNLWKRIPDSDCRKLWWINPDTRGSNAQYYTAADGDAVAYLEEVEAPDYGVVKFAPYQNVLGQSQNESDVPLMRIEEMYLVLAEAQGMGGNLAEGIQTLNSFVNNYRWLGSTPYSCNATNAEEFLDEIWFQRRVELWGEGMAYFDIMRLNKPVDRKNSNWEEDQYLMKNYAYYIPAGADVLRMPIPQTEIDNNPMLTEADQNPLGEASL